MRPRLGDTPQVLGGIACCQRELNHPEEARQLLDRVLALAPHNALALGERGRLAFQWRSVLYLLRTLRSFDVVLSQEMGRGSLNATAVGKALRTPVVLYLGTSPVEYFRCRRIRGQVGRLRGWASETFLAAAMKVTGALSSGVVTTGPYLGAMAAPLAPRVFEGYYCGIDADLFKPVTREQRVRLRERLQFPAGKFVILFPSRISHEKDPETVLRYVPEPQPAPEQVFRRPGFRGPMSADERKMFDEIVGRGQSKKP